MKRSELARGVSKLRRTRLKPRSAKRVDEQDAYLDARMQVNVRDHGRCQAQRLVADGPCVGQNDPHHVWPTGHGGPRCDVANIVTCCRRHHMWIHDGANMAAALERGLLAGRRGVTVDEAERRRVQWTSRSSS